MTSNNNLNNNQKLLIGLTVFVGTMFLFVIGRYWYSDFLYSKAKNLNLNGDLKGAQSILEKLITISPNEPLYHMELSDVYAKSALANEDPRLIEPAVQESKLAVDLSPANVNLKRARFTMFIRFFLLDKKYIADAIETLNQALLQAPTDAKLLYNLGLSMVRIGEIDKAMEILEKTIELKSNYKDARLAYAFLLIDKGEKAKAKENLEYILKYIEPNDSVTIQTLEEIK